MLDQGYRSVEACCAVGVAESVLRHWVLQLAEERSGVTPQSEALTAEQQKIQAQEAKVAHQEREKAIKNGYRALDVGRVRTYALIDPAQRRGAGVIGLYAIGDAALLLLRASAAAPVY